MKRAPLFWAGVAFVTIAAAYARRVVATPSAPDETPGVGDIFGGIFIPEITIQAHSKDADTLARTAWGEARNQGAAGMQAVMNSVMNRRAISARTIAPDWWGETITEICIKSVEKSGRLYFQYAAWDPTGPNRAHMMAVTPDDTMFAVALDLALRAVRGELPDITGGATHYYANYIPAPAWTEGATQTAQYGRHLFFKNVA